MKLKALKKSVLFKQEMHDVDYGNFCKVKMADFALGLGLQNTPTLGSGVITSSSLAI